VATSSIQGKELIAVFHEYSDKITRYVALVHDLVINLVAKESKNTLRREVSRNSGNQFCAFAFTMLKKSQKAKDLKNHHFPFQLHNISIYPHFSNISNIALLAL
jgi:hypothetical protein